MGIREQLQEDLKIAMRAKEADRLGVIRFVQAAIKNREIELRPNAIGEQDVLGVLKKLAKQRQDSIEQFAQAGRQDLVDKEKSELAILEAYMPKALPVEELTRIVTAVIEELKADSVKQMGAVIKEVQVRTQGAADNRQISEIVKSKLQG